MGMDVPRRNVMKSGFGHDFCMHQGGCRDAQKPKGLLSLHRVRQEAGHSIVTVSKLLTEGGVTQTDWRQQALPAKELRSVEAVATVIACGLAALAKLAGEPFMGVQDTSPIVPDEGVEQTVFVLARPIPNTQRQQ